MNIITHDLFVNYLNIFGQVWTLCLSVHLLCSDDMAPTSFILRAFASTEVTILLAPLLFIDYKMGIQKQIKYIYIYIYIMGTFLHIK
jgi:hypothetical protein